MVDNPLNRGTNMGSDLVPATKSNTTDLEVPGRAIRCRSDGTGGALKIRTNAGEERTTYIAPGETLYVAVIRVFDTGTAATNLELYI